MAHRLPAIRTRTGILQPEVCAYWGTTLQPGEDAAAPVIGPDVLGSVVLPDAFPRLPAEHWARVVSLYRHVLPWARESTTPDSTCEVSVVFLRGNGAQRPVDAWAVYVPEQAVGGAHVDTNYDRPIIDLETGARYSGGLPEATGDGWVHAGTSHSHGTLQAFFSGRDDKSELTQPGLHVVVGQLTDTTYTTAVSIVRRGIRYQSVVTPDGLRPLALADVVDNTPNAAVFAPRAMDNVTQGRLTTGVTGYTSRNGSESSWPIVTYAGSEASAIVYRRGSSPHAQYVYGCSYRFLDVGEIYYLTRDDARDDRNPQTVGAEDSPPVATTGARPTSATTSRKGRKGAPRERRHRGWQTDRDALRDLVAGYPALADAARAAPIAWPDIAYDVLAAVLEIPGIVPVLDAAADAARESATD